MLDMTHVRPETTVRSALAACLAGMPDRDNALVHGVAVSTIRRWRRLYQQEGQARGQGHTTAPCPRCDVGRLHEAAYAELLGWYLGDGHISAGRRGVWNLHVFNDVVYPDLNDRIALLMTLVKPGGRPHVRLKPGCVVTTVSWKHWPCLFPQHGPGKKHHREIALTDWQHDIVARRPGPLLAGLFHSDGCRVANWTHKRVGGELKRYDYPRWQFSNRSEDILGLCCWALDLVGVAWRRSGPSTVSVSTRAGVARLDDLVGLKS
jgi:hypothetical protein